MSEKETPKRSTYQQKQDWVIARLDSKWEFLKRTTVSGFYAPDISSSDEDDEEAWHQQFGGARKYYTMGVPVSPGFSRTLREMFQAGILYRYTQGNQDARSCNLKTYCVSYCLKSHVHEATRLNEQGKPPEPEEEDDDAEWG